MLQLTFSINGGLSNNIPASGFTDLEQRFIDIDSTGSPVTVIDISELRPVHDGLAIALGGLKDQPVAADPAGNQSMAGMIIRETGAMSLYRLPPSNDFTEDGRVYMAAIGNLFAGMAKLKLFRYSYSGLPRMAQISTDADPWFSEFSIHGKYLYLYRE